MDDNRHTERSFPESTRATERHIEQLDNRVDMVWLAKADADGF